MALRFVAVFAATNTLALGAVAAFARGGSWIALGALLGILALAGFVVIARVVIVARPAPRPDVADRRLRARIDGRR